MSWLSAVAAALVVVTPVVSADLGGYLERSATAEFSGEQLVACDTPDGSRDAVFEVAQSEGVVAAWSAADDDSLVTVGLGTMATISGDQIAATAVEGTDADVDSPSYEIGSEESVTYLGRPAQDVAIRRDGVERVRLTVDVDTEAVVRTQTFLENGSLYCDRRLLSFEPDAAAELPDRAEIDVDPASPMESSPAALPATTQGFDLLDTYQLDDGTLSYYSDGFFSLGVVVTDRPVQFGAVEDVVSVTTDSGEYQRLYSAGRVTVVWETGSENLALIGDLPPDLVEGVLADLPAPVDAGFFERIWMRLFG